jgi:copper homeostasis protein CutC
VNSKRISTDHNAIKTEINNRENLEKFKNMEVKQVLTTNQKVKSKVKSKDF